MILEDPKGVDSMSSQVGSGEVRMLIDGELVEAASGKRFDNINPATEEVLGQVADASAEDMQRAIDAARRAFDETDWSTNRALRKRCLEQLQAALESEREEYREEIIAEVGSPRMMTFAAQVDWPHRRGPGLAGQDDRRVRVGAVAARLRDDGHGEPARRHQGADGRHRLHRPVELPASRSRSTSWARSWPPATRRSSSRRPTRPGTPPGSAASSPRRPTSPPAWSTW